MGASTFCVPELKLYSIPSSALWRCAGHRNFGSPRPGVSVRFLATQKRQHLHSSGKLRQYGLYLGPYSNMNAFSSASRQFPLMCTRSVVLTRAPTLRRLGRIGRPRQHTASPSKSLTLWLYGTYNERTLAPFAPSTSCRQFLQSRKAGFNLRYLPAALPRYTCCDMTQTLSPKLTPWADLRLDGASSTTVAS